MSAQTYSFINAPRVGRLGRQKECVANLVLNEKRWRAGDDASEASIGHSSRLSARQSPRAPLLCLRLTVDLGYNELWNPYGGFVINDSWHFYVKHSCML